MTGSILLADNDMASARLLQSSIAEALPGTPLFHVKDGEGAIRFLSGLALLGDHKSPPTPLILLADANLPKKNGLEVLEWIKTQESLRRLSVIVLSGAPCTLMVSRAYELGAKACLAKPGDLAGMRQLAESLKIWVDFGEILETAGKEEPPGRSRATAAGEDRLPR